MRQAEALDTGSRLLPMSPFDKKSISVDESVTKNLDEEWDEKEAILNAIRAKQEVSDATCIEMGRAPWLVKFPGWESEMMVQGLQPASLEGKLPYF